MRSSHEIPPFRQAHGRQSAGESAIESSPSRVMRFWREGSREAAGKKISVADVGGDWRCAIRRNRLHGQDFAIWPSLLAGDKKQSPPGLVMCDWTMASRQINAGTSTSRCKRAWTGPRCGLPRAGFSKDDI